MAKARVREMPYDDPTELVLSETVADEYTQRFFCRFLGADVPGRKDDTVISVVLSFNDDLTALRTKVAAAVRAKATALGFTVPNNHIMLPGFVKA